MEKEFGCQQCGHTFIASPPDNIHTLLSLQKIQDTGIKIDYDCDKCHKRNIRYWYKPNSRPFASSSCE